MSNYILQELNLTASAPPITWHDEGVLQTPRPLFPAEGESVCMHEVVSGDIVNTLPIVQWAASPGATHYIMQWCLNSSFHGPTLDAIKTTDTFFAFTGAKQVPQQVPIHWRVFAIDGAGKVSSKSDSRTFTFDCNSGKGDGSGKGGSQSLCQQYGVKLEIKGVEKLRCVDKDSATLTLQYPCFDPCGNVLIELTAVVWTWFGDFTKSCVTLKPVQDDPAFPPMRVEIRSNCCKSFEMTLRAQAFFYDHKLGAPFSCYVDEKVSVDCDVKRDDKPVKLPCAIYHPFDDYIVDYLPEVVRDSKHTTLQSEIYFVAPVQQPFPDKDEYAAPECSCINTYYGYNGSYYGMIEFYDPKCNLYDSCFDTYMNALSQLYLGCGLYFSNHYPPTIDIDWTEFRECKPCDQQYRIPDEMEWDGYSFIRGGTCLRTDYYNFGFAAWEGKIFYENALQPVFERDTYQTCDVTITPCMILHMVTENEDIPEPSAILPFTTQYGCCQGATFCDFVTHVNSRATASPGAQVLMSYGGDCALYPMEYLGGPGSVDFCDIVSQAATDAGLSHSYTWIPSISWSGSAWTCSFFKLGNPCSCP